MFCFSFFSRTIFRFLFLTLFLGLMTTAGRAQNFFPPLPAAKSSIDFDNRGFLIHGKRTFIASAGIEYVRVPRALWRDRLLRIKRAGFNCIEIEAFWNYHEIQEGKFDFNGDKDVGAFLDLVNELGLYAVVRVGPYVCAEWENGGYPMWLRFKSGMWVRQDDAQFEKYSDGWYDQILPIVASRQIEHGGPVIMVQLENEHPEGWGTSQGGDAKGYFKHLMDKARSLGIDVLTFYSGMNHGGDPAPKTPISSNGRSNPWFTTEFWSGWYNWYGSMSRNGDQFTHYTRAAWRFLENGGNGFNVYMFHGGTNFATWNNNETGASYDYAGAVGQTGDLRDIYYSYKRVALFARSFESILEDCDDSSDGYKNETSGVTVAARTGPAGTLLFLDNPLKTPVGAKLADGYEIKLAAGEVVGLVRDFSLNETFKIAASEARILGFVGQGNVTTLVLHGNPGETGQVRFAVASTSGQKVQASSPDWTIDAAHPELVTLKVRFPEKEPLSEMLTVGDKKLRVIALSSALADDTYFIDSKGTSYVVCGAPYVGDFEATSAAVQLTAETALDAKASPPMWIYGPADKPRELASSTLSQIDASAPALKDWQSAAAYPEAAPDFDDSQWKSSNDPLPMGADGDTSAYAWYRTKINADTAGKKYLQIPFVGDHAIVFLNGDRVPAPSARGRATIPLALRAGSNTLAILTSHSGRDKFADTCGPIELLDRKGLVGPIRLSATDTSPVALAPGKVQGYWKEHPPVETLIDPNLDTSSPKWMKLIFDRGPGYYSAAFGNTILREYFVCYRTLLPDVPGPNRNLHFGFAYDKLTAYLNGQKLGENLEPGVPFDFSLDKAWKEGGPNLLVLLIDSKPHPFNTAGLISLNSGDPAPIVTGWKMRGDVTDFNAPTLKWDKALVTAPGVPTYYRTAFTLPADYYKNATPILRFSVKGLSRGFVWLNGHNIGRYPETTDVDGLYLPECWMKQGTNNLFVLDEEGALLTPAAHPYVETIASRRVLHEGN